MLNSNPSPRKWSIHVPFLRTVSESFSIGAFKGAMASCYCFSWLGVIYDKLGAILYILFCLLTRVPLQYHPVSQLISESLSCCERIAWLSCLTRLTLLIGLGEAWLPENQARHDIDFVKWFHESNALSMQLAKKITSSSALYQAKADHNSREICTS